MRQPLTFIKLLILLSALTYSSSAWADIKVITAEATYTMGDGESPSFAEAMVLQKAKQMALEQAGTYVESYTKVHNLSLSTEEIQTIAGGVLKVEVLEKQRELIGDGLRHYVKIKATVTTDKMEELARRIKGKHVAAEYKTLQEYYARLSKELEALKQLIAKSPPGPQREAALGQFRERESAFAGIQKSEEGFFHRVVSGAILVTEGLNEQGLIDRLFKQILQEGHMITVGQPKILPVSKKSDQARIVVLITLTPSHGILASLKETARVLDGVSIEKQSLEIVDSNVLVGVNPESDSPTTTLVRVAKEIELSRYFQELTANLALVVEVADRKASLAQCTWRHYAETALPLTESERVWRSGLIDRLLDAENERLDNYRIVKALTPLAAQGTLSADQFIKLAHDRFL